MNPEYRDYKDNLADYLKELEWDENAYWCKMFMAAIYPYPKGTPRHLKEGIYRLSGGMRGDWDNLAKPIPDALQDIGVLDNDSQIFSGRVDTFRSLLGAHQIVYLYGVHKENRSICRVRVRGVLV